MPFALFAGGIATALERPAPGELDLVTLAAAAGGGVAAWAITTVVTHRPRAHRTRRVTTAAQEP